MVQIARRQGLRFLWLNLSQRVWFDLRHGTDTTRPLAKTQFAAQPDSFDGGSDYAGAFTDEVVWAYRQLRQHLGDRFSDYVFADVGCGKGKVLIVWNLCLRRDHLRQRTVGIEYYEPLVEIASRNCAKVLEGSPELHHADAGAFDYTRLGRRAIFFLYNPFDATVMARFARAIDGIDAYVVYNHPRFANILQAAGFTEVTHKSGRHVNEHSIVLHRSGETP